MSVRGTLRRTWPVVLVYALFMLWGVGCLLASLLVSPAGAGILAGGLPTLAVILGTCAVGHVLGTVLGLAGFRLGPILALFAVAFLGIGWTGVALGAWAFVPLLGTFAVLGGYLGVASRLDVVAAWFPLAFAVAAAVIWMNQHGAVALFKSGQKHAVWDPFTVVCLAGAVFFFLLFLVTRSSLGLTTWQSIGRASELGAAGADDVPVARPGRGSIVVLLGLTFVVVAVTAVASPYLFRTERSEPREHPGQTEEPPPSYGEPPPADGDDEARTKAMEHMLDLLKLAFRVFLGIVLLVLLALVFRYAILPPFQRRFLLRHLETPRWPVAPTARVMNLWRRALAALAVVELVPEPGEPPTAFAARAGRELGAADPAPLPGMVEAAAIVERIHYAGRGLGPGDEAAMRAAVLAFLAALEPRFSARQRLRAAWSQTPEVES